METLRFDTAKPQGAFKLLNATNGGPWHKRHVYDQVHSNFADYKAARIPYSRNHDSGVMDVYGGPFSHDITRIFRNFDADPTDPASYDFACTDESIFVTLDAGTETYFRLGQTIEHHIKKHDTLPPKDFHKWAVICEHIIRHYNEGWANGYHLGIKYWEIWNEPDLDPDDADNKRTWGGTQAQFFDLYEITAKHLKSCFPDLMIGGPALSGKLDWGEEFLREMQKRNVPMDFFSWHIYTNNAKKVGTRAEKVKALLDKYGYGAAESHLNEWNYIKDWTDQFVYSVETITGAKGAAFVMACMCVAQHSPIDLLMYYDTRPSIFNGAFSLYTCRPLKGYYPLYWYGKFYDCTAEIQAENELPDLYSLCGIDENGRTLTALSYYTDNDDAPARTVKLDFGRSGRYKAFLVDAEHTNASLGETSDPTFTLPANSCLFIQEL